MRQLDENQTGIIADKHSPNANDIIRIIRGPLKSDPRLDLEKQIIFQMNGIWHMSIGFGDLERVTAWAELPKVEE